MERVCDISAHRGFCRSVAMRAKPSPCVPISSVLWASPSHYSMQASFPPPHTIPNCCGICTDTLIIKTKTTEPVFQEAVLVLPQKDRNILNASRFFKEPGISMLSSLSSHLLHQPLVGQLIWVDSAATDSTPAVMISIRCVHNFGGIWMLGPHLVTVPRGLGDVNVPGEVCLSGQTLRFQKTQVIWC